jgi:hypothetical protein
MRLSWGREKGRMKDEAYSCASGTERSLKLMPRPFVEVEDVKGRELTRGKLPEEEMLDLEDDEGRMGESEGEGVR